MGFKKSYINHQKSRIDYILDFHNNKSIAPNIKEIYTYLKNKYIIGTIEHQKYDFFKYAKPDIIVMDSFSELTDQLFINTQNKTRFLANYTDVDQNILSKQYECVGLIKENTLFESYDKFFYMVEKIYPETPLYFIHFSTVLDPREKFKSRGKKIQEIIEKLSKRYEFIHSLSIDDSLVLKANGKNEEFNNFPYHYNDKTYSEYLNIFKQYTFKNKSIGAHKR